jgi:hypothetical protein
VEGRIVAVTTDEPADPRRFAGVSVPDPEFAGDDGSADPRLSEVVTSYDDGRCSRRDLVSALLTSRLMTPLMAVLDEVEESPGGLRQEKSSHLASVSLVAGDGRRALLAFTSVAAMAAWDPSARAVPALAIRVAAGALADGADAVLLDHAGPVRVVVDGTALEALAGGVLPVPPWEDPAVAAAVLVAAGQIVGLARVGLTPSDDPSDPGAPDLVVVIELEPGADPDMVAEQVARRVLAAPAVAEACPRGVVVALSETSRD